MNSGAAKLQAAGVSLAEIARAAGVSRAAAAKWRTGAAVPGVGSRDKLARAFGIDPPAWEVSSTPPAANASALEVPPGRDLAAMLDGPEAVQLAVREHLDRIAALRTAAIARGDCAGAAAALDLERRAILEFGRDAGEAAIVGSARWKEIRAALVEAVRPWPAAMRAIVAALERIGT